MFWDRKNISPDPKHMHLLRLWVRWQNGWLYMYFPNAAQNQNSVPVKHQQTFIHQDQQMRGLVSGSHQWCESKDAILRTFGKGYSTYWECIPISNSFWEETVFLSIWDLKWFWMMVSSVPVYTYLHSISRLFCMVMVNFCFYLNNPTRQSYGQNTHLSDCLHSDFNVRLQILGCVQSSFQSHQIICLILTYFTCLLSVLFVYHLIIILQVTNYLISNLLFWCASRWKTVCPRDNNHCT